MTSPAPEFITEDQRFAHYIADRFDRLEEMVMATKEQLEKGLGELTSSITRLGANVQTSHTRTIEQLAAMQKTLDDFVAADTTEDADFQATIDTLTRQLADATASSDTTLTTVQSLTAAVQDINRSIESGV
jgi:uncharacterized protein YoxC